MPEHNLINSLLGTFSWARLLRSSALIALCVYLYFLGYGIFFSERLIFLPQPASYRDDDRIIKLTDADGTAISVRYLPNPAARFTILLSHGNAEDLGDLEPLLRAYQTHGYAVISYDYSGYGTSGGTPSEAATYTNIRAVYDYLIQQQVAADSILLLGRSLGSGPGVELATQRRVGGLILESAFTSVFRTMTHIRIYPVDKFDNLGRITAVNCPVLIMHGTHDTVLPLRHGEQLYRRARPPKMKFWVPGADHNDLLPVAKERYWSTLEQFTTRLTTARRAETPER